MPAQLNPRGGCHISGRSMSRIMIGSKLNPIRQFQFSFNLRRVKMSQTIKVRLYLPYKPCTPFDGPLIIHVCAFNLPYSFTPYHTSLLPYSLSYPNLNPSLPFFCPYPRDLKVASSQANIEENFANKKQR